MKKNIGLIVVLLLLIVSVVGNVILANNWMGAKAQVSDLIAKVEEFNTNNTAEENDVKDDTESTEIPETVVEEKYILPVVNPDNENNVVSEGYKIWRRRFSENYDKLSVYYNEGEGLKVGFDGNYQKVDIGEKMPADIVIVPYANGVELAKVVILFTDGTAKYIEYLDCMSNAIKLYDVDIEEKIIAIKQVFVYSEANERGRATGVAIIEDGSAVEIDFHNK